MRNYNKTEVKSQSRINNIMNQKIFNPNGSKKKIKQILKNHYYQILRMTRFDVILGKNIIPTKKRTLRLILDEDEEIIQCIKQGLQENNIKKASVKSIKGIVKNCNISIIEEGRKELENIEILNTNGIFSIGGDDLWGQLNVFVGTKKPLVGKLVKGIASQNLEIILEY